MIDFNHNKNNIKNKYINNKYIDKQNYNKNYLKSLNKKMIINI